MRNNEKAAYLYSYASSMLDSGNTLAAQELEKLADHFGSLFIKESLAYAKKKVKKAMIEKPIKTSMPHPGNSNKQDKTASAVGNALKKVRDFGSSFNASQGILPAAARNLGKGALIATPLVAGAYYAAPHIARRSAQELTKGTSEGIMDTVKEYAVPAALLLGGLGIGGFAMSRDKGRNMGYTPNPRGSFSQMPSSRGMSPRMPSRRKMAHVIQGIKHRSKLAAHFGENSDAVEMCDKAISRILFRQ
jgi:hypothetical protein